MPLQKKIKEALDIVMEDVDLHFRKRVNGGWPLDVSLLREEVERHILGVFLADELVKRLILKHNIVIKNGHITVTKGKNDKQVKKTARR